MRITKLTDLNRIILSEPGHTRIMTFIKRSALFWVLLFLSILITGCLPEKRTSQVKPLDLEHPIATLTSVALTANPWTETPEWKPSSTPEPTANQLTPIPTHPQFKLDRIPTLRASTTEHTVASGETITMIASNYQVSKNALTTENNIKNPDLISVGQELIIPAQLPDFQDAGYIILPDERIINGPATVDFDIPQFFLDYPESYLANYSEPKPTPIPEVDKSLDSIEFIPRSGFEILNQTTIQNSIDPRVLIALMEFQTHSISEKKPNGNQKNSTIVHLGTYYESLARQLAWAADTLNYGYYNWKNNRINQWILDDDTVVAVNPDINPGTAALQYLFSKIYGKDDWIYAISKNGFLFTYQQLFGEIPEDVFFENTPELIPKLELPFSSGEIWSFTGGPHVGWADGTPWAAVDFAPPDAVGCSISSHWVTASAAGEILYSQNGLVIEDLDGDGNMQTGWVLIYLHIETRDRISTGTHVNTGDPIGHPSCEGGIANGSHVHLARRYNGEWVPIDLEFPMILSGWEVFSTGTHYDGYLEKNGRLVEAWYFKTKESEIAY